MSLIEALKNIENIKNIKVKAFPAQRGNTANSHFSDVSDYNEMTFISYFKDQKATRICKKEPPISQTIDKLFEITSLIQKTNLNEFDSIIDVDNFANKIAPNMQAKECITDHTTLQSDINEAWLAFLCYGQSTDDFPNKASVVNHFENLREDIDHIAIKLDAFYKSMNNFLLHHYTLIDELSKSVLHKDDKDYVISVINNHKRQIPQMSEMIELYEQYKRLNVEFKDAIKKKINELDPNTFITMADNFITSELKHSERNSVENFLMTKLLESDVVSNIDFTASQKIEKAFLFKDNSIAYKKNNQYHTIKDKDTLENFITELHNDAVSFLLRKKPKLINFFQSLMKEQSGYSFAIKTISSLLDNYTVLKQYNFDVNNFADKTFEVIDDSINEIVYKNKIKQYAFSILSAKYKQHFNETTEPYFKSLYDNGVTTSQLQNFVGKKIAALKSNEETVNMLSHLLDHFDGFTQEALDTKLKSFNINKIHDKNNIVTLEVTNYEQCKAFGSTSWCIVRDEDYFDQYVTNHDNKQYIIYDFNKKSTEIESMIGFTVSPNGNIYAEHLKNDDSISSYKKDENLIYIQMDTIYSNKEKHNLSDETMNDMLKIIENKNITPTKPLKQRMS